MLFPSFHRLIDTPGRVFAIFAGVKEAYIVAVRIVEIGLSPEPGAVGGVFVKSEAKGFEAFDLGVKITAFEIESYAFVRFNVVGDVDGECRFTIGALEPGVPRQGVDDTPEAELFEEFDRLDWPFGMNSDLIEIQLLDFRAGGIGAVAGGHGLDFSSVNAFWASSRYLLSGYFSTMIER